MADDGSAPVRELVGTAQGTGFALNVHRGQVWRFLAAPEGETLPAPAENRTYKIKVRNSTIGSKETTIAAPAGTRFDVQGDKVYIADWSALRVFGKVAGAWSQIGSLGMSAATDVVVDGKYAYVAINRGILIEESGDDLRVEFRVGIHCGDVHFVQYQVPVALAPPPLGGDA